MMFVIPQLPRVVRQFFWSRYLVDAEPDWAQSAVIRVAADTPSRATTNAFFKVHTDIKVGWNRRAASRKRVHSDAHIDARIKDKLQASVLSEDFIQCLPYIRSWYCRGRTIEVTFQIGVIRRIPPGHRRESVCSRHIAQLSQKYLVQADRCTSALQPKRPVLGPTPTIESGQKRA